MLSYKAIKGIKRIISSAFALICAIGLSAQNYIKNPAMIECGESNVQIVYLHQSTDPVLKQTEERYPTNTIFERLSNVITTPSPPTEEDGVVSLKRLIYFKYLLLM